MDLTPIDVHPVRHEEQVVLLHPGGMKRIMVPVYPHSLRAAMLRQARIVSGYGLRSAASRIGVSPTVLSGLEHGQLTLPTAQWEQLIDTIQKWESKR